MAKLKMEALARRAVRPHRGETALELVAGTLAVGDAVTGSDGTVSVGVPVVRVRLDEIGEREDNAVIVVRARTTEVVRWTAAATGGVDSGVFGVWDATRRPTGSGNDEPCTGPCTVAGRFVFALQTGDGVFPCVAGLDAAGDVSCIVAGPGVDPDWFGIVDEAEVTAREAAEAEARATIAAGPLGDGSCPVATWFVASLDPTTQAAARACGPDLRAASDAKKAKAQRLARLALVLEWAMGRLRVLTQERFPAEATALPAGTLATKGTIKWAKPLFDLHDYAMAARRFDLERELSGQPKALEAVRAALSTARLGRLGVMSLRALREHVEFSANGYKVREESLPDIIVALAGALERALELQVLEAYARDRTTSAPRPIAWLDTLLDDLDGRDPPSAIVARM